MADWDGVIVRHCSIYKRTESRSCDEKRTLQFGTSEQQLTASSSCSGTNILPLQMLRSRSTWCIRMHILSQTSRRDGCGVCGLQLPQPSSPWLNDHRPSDGIAEMRNYDRTEWRSHVYIVHVVLDNLLHAIGVTHLILNSCVCTCTFWPCCSLHSNDLLQQYAVLRIMNIRHTARCPYKHHSLLLMITLV